MHNATQIVIGSLQQQFQHRLNHLGRFSWTLHNIVGHPLSEVLHQVGLARASNFVHDVTVPIHTPGTGRG